VLRPRTGILAALIVVVPLVLAGLGASPAHGALRTCGTLQDGPCSSASGTGGSLSVQLEGTGVPGYTTTVKVPRSTLTPVCYVHKWLSGREYYENWQPPQGEFYLQAQAADPTIHPWKPMAGYETHAEDDDGHYWLGTCDVTRSAGVDTSKFYAEHPPAWVAAGDPEPAVDLVSPAVLGQFASDSTRFPHGDLHWNPTRDGDAATFVGLDTWLWLGDRTSRLWVTASLGGVSATAISTFKELQVSWGVTHRGSTTCRLPSAGTPWTPDAPDDDPGACIVHFDHSSAGEPDPSGTGPRTRVVATSIWTGSWTSPDAPGDHPLTLDPLTTTAAVPVAEIEAQATLGSRRGVGLSPRSAPTTPACRRCPAGRP